MVRLPNHHLLICCAKTSLEVRTGVTSVILDGGPIIYIFILGCGLQLLMPTNTELQLRVLWGR